MVTSGMPRLLAASITRPESTQAVELGEAVDWQLADADCGCLVGQGEIVDEQLQIVTAGRRRGDVEQEILAVLAASPSETNGGRRPVHRPAVAATRVCLFRCAANRRGHRDCQCRWENWRTAEPGGLARASWRRQNAGWRRRAAGARPGCQLQRNRMSPKARLQYRASSR